MKNFISVFVVAGILLLNPIASKARLVDDIVQALNLQELFPWTRSVDTVISLAKDCAGYTGNSNSVQDIITNGSQLSVYHCLQDKTSFEAAGGDAQKYGGIAMGRFSVAQDEDTIAIGDSASAEESQAISIGSRSKAQGKFATALGFLSKAEGRSAIALGHQAKAIGNSAVSLKGNAQGSGAIAIGSAANAFGTWSRAIGINTYADGDYSTVIGVNNYASGEYSVVIGDYIDSQADHAFTIGSGYTNNQGRKSTLVNNTPNSLIIGFNSSKPSFFVGDSVTNGNTGSVGIGTISPEAKLDVAGGAIIRGKLEAISAKVGEANFNQLYSNGAEINGKIVAENADIDHIETDEIRAHDKIYTNFLSSSILINHGQFSSGGGNSVSGEGSATIGMRNRSLGNSAITLGYKNMAIRTEDKASGQPEEAMGPVAIGYENIARGTGSIAMGTLSKAEAEHSIAIGQHVTTNGESSIALGHDITNNTDNSLLIGFEESTALFATTGIQLTKRMKDLERDISLLEQRIEYYQPYAERYPWLKAHVNRWVGFLNNYKEELADLMKANNQALVGINTNEPKRSLHISGVMRLEPQGNAPLEPVPGDLYMDSSDALCVYMQNGWQKIVGNGYCY